MDLTIQMRIFSSVKHGPTICLKFGHKFFISLKMLYGLKQKPVSALQSNKIYFFK